jgi:glycosyltransferase involved in cell wall biosynthesis
VAKYLADELARMPGLSLSVVVPHGTHEPAVVSEVRGGVRLYWLPHVGIWKRLPGTLYDIVAGKEQLRSFLRSLEPDIVHFQGTTFLAAGCERSNVLTIHGIAEKDAVWDRRRGLGRWMKRLVLKLTEEYGRRRVPHVIVISDSVTTVLPRAGPKTWRIDNPIADSFFEVVRDADPGRIFCCSKIRPLKNILGMIAAFARVARRAPHCTLRIAGTAEPEYLSACVRQAEKEGVRSKVHFLGSLSVAGVQRELSKADCFAMVSFQESAPLSVAEAMAAGVPVVAAGVGGLPEMVAHGATGFIVDSRNPREIGDAIERILSDPTLAREMGRRARELARGRYMASVVAGKTVEAYREIIAARG